jgi:5'(3')-deoxyribonucleotidase
LVQTIGVDIDGVLGNQVHGVLERVRPRGVDLTYDDITHWDVPLGSTSFVPEINAAMLDDNYVLKMPVHDGAQAMLAALRARYKVHMLTVRPASALGSTYTWLATNRLAYDELAIAQEARKSLHQVDALVDDYPLNVVEFLESTAGPAVLVDQPWNRDVTDLGRWSSDPRLVRVTSLREVPASLDRLLIGE